MNILTNYSFNFNAIPPTIVSILILTTGLVIFFQNARSATNRFFLLGCLSVFVWLSGMVMIYLSKDEALAMLWFKYYTHLGIISIAPNLHFFTRSVTQQKKNISRWVIFSYIFILIFYLLDFLPDFNRGIKMYPWGWYPQYGPLSYAFFCFFAFFMVLCLVELVFAWVTSDSRIEKKKLKILLIGNLIGYLGALDFLPALGLPLYPAGCFMVFIWIVLMAYAVLRYKLMTMTPAVAAGQIISIIPDFIVLADAKGKITQVNRAVEETLKYKERELEGKEIKVLFADKSVADHLLQDLIKSGSIRNFETAYRSKEKKRIPVVFSASIVREPKEEIQGMVLAALDITAIKDSEEELRRISAQLVQSSKMASIGLLAGGVAHEINNPLTGVLNNVQLIKLFLKQGKEFNIDSFTEMLETIESSALRCKNITKSLLEFSHASKGTFQPLSLSELAEKVVSLVEHELKLQNIIIHKDLRTDLPATSGDRQLLQQVIFDIINNARWAIKTKNTQETGTITMKTEYTSGSGMIFLYISDTGIGITKENQERVFEPFFTTKDVGEGTGLGLSIVYKIISAHNGNIEVSSEVGKGTTFKISLPVAT